MAITWQERGIEAEAFSPNSPTQASGPLRAQIAILRAMNFTRSTRSSGPRRKRTRDVPADDDAAQAIATALRALIDAGARKRQSSGRDRANTMLAGAPASDLEQMLLAWVLVTGLGDLGRIDEIEPRQTAGYAVADRSPEVSHLRHPLAFLQSYGYRLAGALTQSDAVIARIWRDTLDVPFEESWHSVLVGMSAMSRGALDDARRSLREAVAYLGTGDSGRMMKTFARSWLTTVAAMVGRASDARREFDAIEWWAREPDACMVDSEKSIAEAWTCAAEGAVLQAISITRDAAQENASSADPPGKSCPADGDPVRRPHDCLEAGRVGRPSPRPPCTRGCGPRRSARRGKRGRTASTRPTNTRRSATASPPPTPPRKPSSHTKARGLRGAALSASATARRLAAECQGAQTPAIGPPPRRNRSRPVSAKSSRLLQKDYRTRRSPTGSPCRSAPSKDTSSAPPNASEPTAANS